MARSPALEERRRIPVTVPDPARYADHKLIVTSRRRVEGNSKARRRHRQNDACFAAQTRSYLSCD
ncbi:GSU2403 family nucleotidyltransferase fold protein [Rhizobium sp. LC145]|uniref:GSU2403 family nucleotidyltransferase fold protein n=1 Tax=Rhizobium sp. LC145 TaxID=1120688 RepID=UPI0009E5E7E5|nr:GSU2403 family nucleotidyltransferase fold protein [Rhizobium sp. LC145]TKT57312.1 hypothetical protein FDR95_13585 [Rhizobiaceae bacterium LC148]